MDGSGDIQLGASEDAESVAQKARLSSFCVLLFAFLSFFLFAVAEIFGAVFSNSLSLLGDATTMIVDSITYLFNMYAEYKKPGETQHMYMYIYNDTRIRLYAYNILVYMHICI